MKGEMLTNERGPRARYLRITTEREARNGAREKDKWMDAEKKREKGEREKQIYCSPRSNKDELTW